jgi:isopenicillin N synthase-like dioxygenase
MMRPKIAEQKDYSLMRSPISDSEVKRLKDDGFLLISVSDIVWDKVAATFAAAYPFFRASAEEKNLNKLPNDCGYRPIGIEYSQSPERPDPAESFTASTRVCAPAIELLSVSARILYERMLDIINSLEQIAETLTIQLANTLTSQPMSEKLHGAFNRWSCLQINYSRPSDVTTPFIHEPHEDGHLLTIACVTGPGLQLQIRNDDYMPITTAPNEVLIMPGEIASLLSGGQIRPLYHRVCPDPSYQERMALLFFGDIHPQLCEPWILNDVNTNIDIGARVLTNSSRFGTEAFRLE